MKTIFLLSCVFVAVMLAIFYFTVPVDDYNPQPFLSEFRTK